MPDKIEQRLMEIIESQEIPLIDENMNYDVDLNDDLKTSIRDYINRKAKKSAQ